MSGHLMRDSRLPSGGKEWEAGSSDYAQCRRVQSALMEQMHPNVNEHMCQALLRFYAIMLYT